MRSNPFFGKFYLCDFCCYSSRVTLGFNYCDMSFYFTHKLPSICRLDGGENSDSLVGVELNKILRDISLVGWPLFCHPPSNSYKDSYMDLEAMHLNSSWSFFLSQHKSFWLVLTFLSTIQIFALLTQILSYVSPICGICHWLITQITCVWHQCLIKAVSWS